MYTYGTQLTGTTLQLLIYPARRYRSTRPRVAAMRMIMAMTTRGHDLSWLMVFCIAIPAVFSSTVDLQAMLQGSETCTPEGTYAIDLNFSKGFQASNNLGGLGPITSHAANIRYASIGSASATFQAWATVAFFCKDVPDFARRTELFGWANGRSCDPHESVANYKQTSAYVDSYHLERYGAQLASVAMSGRIADNPPTSYGYHLNLGILNGSDAYFVNGLAKGEPGHIPGVTGLNVETMHENFTSPQLGQVNWTTGYRQAFGCAPVKTSANDTCLKTALQSGVVIGHAGSSWPEGRGLEAGTMVMDSDQARAILTPHHGCNLANGDASSCPDPNGDYEIILVNTLELMAFFGLPAQNLPCPLIDRWLKPLAALESSDNQLTCAAPSSALCPSDSGDDTWVACGATADMNAGYCVDSSNRAIRTTNPIISNLNGSISRFTCGSRNDLSSQLDVMIVNTSEYTPKNSTCTTKTHPHLSPPM